MPKRMKTKPGGDKTTGRESNRDSKKMGSRIPDEKRGNSGMCFYVN